MKKIISLWLALSLILSLTPVLSYAAPVKDGYSLTPTLFSKEGVDVSSNFLLSAPEATDVESVAAMLSIDGQPLAVVMQKSGQEFIITPSTPLLNNSLYIFRLKQENKADITWTFQTAKKFEITASLPGNEATNVPVDSGIEITFSSEGYTALDNYFNISPQVKGTFEYHKNTAVFVPDALDFKTVYTVTIKSGVTLKETGEALSADYVFAFETQAKPEDQPVKPSQFLYFSSPYTELPTIEAPKVGMWIYSSQNDSRPNPKINVYQFKSGDQAIDAVLKKTGMPGWSLYAKQESMVDAKELSRVMSFNGANSFDHEKGILTLPDKLSQGFYLIDAQLDDSHEQMILQISDLPVQLLSDREKSILWVNDIATGKPAANASVYDVTGNKTYQTDAGGIAVIERPLSGDSGERFDITAKDGKKCTFLYTQTYYSYDYYSGYRANSAAEGYWTNLQLDRTLFQRDDTLSFWGFVKNRKADEEIKNVTAVLTQGYYYRFYGARDILHRQTVAVENNSYSDSIRLPNLDTGSYCLTIYHGDTVLGSTYFNVQDYEKPPYKMEVLADKKAVFANDAVTFTAKAGFFEGTPVSGLDVSYNFYGYGLKTPGNGSIQTDTGGSAAVPVSITPEESTQGETYLTFIAEATLPEIGPTAKSESVRVFINDIDVKPQAKRTGKNASLSVDLHTITLDRLNDGTAKDTSDYLDAPVVDQNVSVEIYRSYWEKQESGKYYDYIEKKTRPLYTYVHREEAIDRFDMTTDQNGAAAKQFTVPDREYESYYAKITCVDKSGRTITKDIYIGEDYTAYYQNANTNNYYLDGAKESYQIDEQVSLTVKRGTEAVTKGSCLFVRMQNGIVDFQVGENPYTFGFTGDHIPNVNVSAYYFNGYNYQSGYHLSANIRFDDSANDLKLSAVTDQKSYKPGDTCSIIVTAKDKNGNPKQANVNISMVDEALFALQDYSVDTLTSLYRDLSTGLTFSASTHKAYSSDARDGKGVGGIAPPAGVPMPTGGLEENSYADDRVEANADYIRELFRDTAIFGTVRTNESGEAVYTFKLPDNITAWRMTLSGISDDLFAGNSTQQINVSNPMFLSYTLNDTFLKGDVPTVGINVYGTGLSGKEQIDFEVWDESAPQSKRTASGAAFERVDIPLWEMTEEGSHALIIKAAVRGGTSDTVKHKYQVLQTYREIDEAKYYDVTADIVFNAGNTGFTTITFTDRSLGQYLQQLIGLRYLYGDRIEKLMARREANKLLKQYFPDLILTAEKESFNPLQYQQKDGGIAILPYASSDLETTVKLIPYIKEDINANALKNYLYSVYQGQNQANKMCALYGLCLLKEPVLLDLQNYAAQDALSVKDAVYLALGYFALGETQAAAALYDEWVAPGLQQLAPYWRVNTGADNDDILAATSAASQLASLLEKPEKEGLHLYCISNNTDDILIGMETLSYIANEIGKKTGEGGSISYSLFGETRTIEFKAGNSYTLRIPAQNISAFKLLGVSGDVGAVSSYKKPLTETKTSDPDVAVYRRYYPANDHENSSTTFKQGDLVRVQIWIDYSAKAIDGSYSVTDYLPAGLAYVDHSAKISGAQAFGFGCYRYARAEGQKVTFYDYNNKFNQGYLYYYYARVISPGTFQAEGPLVQNLTAKDYISLGQDTTIVIE